MRAQPDQSLSFRRILSSPVGCRKSAAKADASRGDLYMADKMHSSDGFICYKRGEYDRA